MTRFHLELTEIVL